MLRSSVIIRSQNEVMNQQYALKSNSEIRNGRELNWMRSLVIDLSSG